MLLLGLEDAEKIFNRYTASCKWLAGSICTSSDAKRIMVFIYMFYTFYFCLGQESNHFEFWGRASCAAVGTFALRPPPEAMTTLRMFSCIVETESCHSNFGELSLLQHALAMRVEYESNLAQV